MSVLLKALAAKDALSPRARKMFLAMWGSKGKVKFELKSRSEYGLLIGELIMAKCIRADWNLLSMEHVFILTNFGKRVRGLLQERKSNGNKESSKI